MTARALSLTRPWPYATTNLGKRIENRSDKRGCVPAVCRYRGELYLHAANSWDGTVAQQLKNLVSAAEGDVLFEKANHPAGVIVARCRVIGRLGPTTVPDPDGPPDYHLDEGDGASLDLRWWFGDHALVLADVEPIDPVPCKGALGVWRVPEDVERQLRRGIDP